LYCIEIGTVSKKTISDLVTILCTPTKDSKALVKSSDRDKAKAYILGVFALCSENADVYEFRHCGLALGNFDDTVVEIIRNFVQGVSGEAKEAQVDDIGDGFLAKLFAQFDNDRSGSLDFDQFQDMLRYLNINLSQEKIVEIFNKVDTDGDKALTYNEFEKGFALLAAEVAMAALQSLGLTDAQIYGVVGSGFLILMGIFAFIFLGMAAFTSNSTFGSVVNSGAVGGSGGATAANSEDAADADDPSMADYLQETIQEALEQLNPE